MYYQEKVADGSKNFLRIEAIKLTRQVYLCYTLILLSHGPRRGEGRGAEGRRGAGGGRAARMRRGRRRGEGHREEGQHERGGGRAAHMPRGRPGTGPTPPACAEQRTDVYYTN